ncbi:MAG TPA: hypothetical protein VII60_07270 [Acidimicrobiales bacterium]
MSEFLGLGVADAESRWVGVRRHQAILVIAGLGLLGHWLTASNAPFVEAFVGVLCLACAAPTTDGLTIGEWSIIGLHFVVRSRWTSIHVDVSESENVMTVDARGEVRLRGFELVHRGRLDLSGRDHDNAVGLASFADALATSGATRHFSMHVLARRDVVSTLLALPEDVSPPAGWTPRTALATSCVGTHALEWMLERWAYVRISDQLIRVLRIRDFSSVPDGHALLEQIQFASTWLDVSLHVEVVAGTKAQRVAARAVHRMGSDDVATQAAGFRRTARSSRTLDRLRQREALVVEGAALLRVAVFLVIRASSLATLERDVASVTRLAFEAGLRCEPGQGRQALWYCAQLPGGPGW